MPDEMKPWTRATQPDLVDEPGLVPDPAITGDYILSSHLHTVRDMAKDLEDVSIKAHSSLAAALAAIGSDRRTLTIPRDSTVNVTDDTVIPKNVVLKVMQGGVLNVAAGKTLTVNRLRCGMHQVFSGSGTVVLGPTVGDVRPEWWGAVGDLVADDTAALRAAAAAAGRNESPVTLRLDGLGYRITKTIFFAEFTSSCTPWSAACLYYTGNMVTYGGVRYKSLQNSNLNKTPDSEPAWWEAQVGFTFPWNGEDKYWGGQSQTAEVAAIRIVSRRSNHHRFGSGIVADFAESAPIFFFMGSSSIHLENVSLTGAASVVPGNPGYNALAARPSEGIFVTVGVLGFTYDRLSIRGCQRGLRIGSLYNWPEDPIKFTDWDNRNPTINGGYPTTTGGWMVDHVSGRHYYATDCQTPLSCETAQTISGVHHSPFLQGHDDDHGLVFLYAGNCTLYDYLASAGPGKCAVHAPYPHNTINFELCGGENELPTGKTLLAEFATDVNDEFHFRIKNWLGGSVEVADAGRITLEHSVLGNVYGTASANTFKQRHVLIKDCVIAGKVGSMSPAYCRFENWVIENCRFTGDGAITTPWTPYFLAHGSNRVNGCTMEGPSFTDDVKTLWDRTQYQKAGHQRIFANRTQADSLFVIRGMPLDTETVTIDGKVYTYQAVLTDVDGHVFIGTGPDTARDNLIAAINLAAGSGTKYAASTTLHPSCEAMAGPETVYGYSVTVREKLGVGADGNAIAVSTMVTAGEWRTATLLGGKDCAVELGTEDLAGAYVPYLLRVWQGPYHRFGLNGGGEPLVNVGNAGECMTSRRIDSPIVYLNLYSHYHVTPPFPAGSRVIGVTYQVTVALPAPATKMAFGLEGDPERYAKDVSTALGTKGFFLVDEVFATDTNLLITVDAPPNGSPDGQIYLGLFVAELIPPTVV